MKLRSLLLFALGLLVLIGVLAIVLLVTVDINRFKPEIEAFVADNSNITLRIEGDLSWQFFPTLAIDIGRATVSINPPGDDSLGSLPSDRQRDPIPNTPAFATVEQVSLRADLLALFDGRLKTDALSIDGVEVNLATDAGGQHNWQGIRFGDDPPASLPDPDHDNRQDNGSDASGTDNSDAQQPPSQRITIDLQQLQLNDISLHYLDASTQQRQSLQLKSLQATDVNLLGKAFTLNAEASLDDPSLGQLDADISASIAYHHADQIITVSELSATAGWRQLADIEPLAIAIAAALSLDMASQVVTDIDLRLQTDITQLSFRGSATYTQNLELGGELSVVTESISRQLNSLGIEAPDTADANVLAATNLKARVAYRPALLQLTAINATLDDIAITGKAGVKPAAGDRQAPGIQLDLKFDAINLDRYLPPPSPKPGATDTPDGTPRATGGTGSATGNKNTGAGSAPSPDDLPLELLSAFDGDITIDAGQLISSGLQLNAFRLNATLDDSLLAIERLSADFYQGKLTVSGQLSARQQTATLRIEEQLTGTQVAPLLDDLDIDELLDGVINVNASLAMRGNSVDAWLHSLSGDTRFELLDGVYRDTNIEHIVCRSIAKVRNKQLLAQWSTDTHFDRIAGAIDWSAGQGQLKELRGGLAILDVQGQGTLSLPQASYQIDLDATLSGDVRGVDPGCEINEKYRDVQWPIECSGNSDDNSCRIDNSRLNKIIRETAKKDLQRQAEKKLEEKLNEKLGDELGDGIRDLLKDGLEGLFK